MCPFLSGRVRCALSPSRGAGPSLLFCSLRKPRAGVPCLLCTGHRCLRPCGGFPAAAPPASRHVTSQLHSQNKEEGTGLPPLYGEPSPLHSSPAPCQPHKGLFMLRPLLPPPHCPATPTQVPGDRAGHLGRGRISAQGGSVQPEAGLGEVRPPWAL